MEPGRGGNEVENVWRTERSVEIAHRVLRQLFLRVGVVEMQEKPKHAETAAKACRGCIACSAGMEVLCTVFFF